MSSDAEYLQKTKEYLYSNESLDFMPIGRKLDLFENLFDNFFKITKQGKDCPLPKDAKGAEFLLEITDDIKGGKTKKEKLKKVEEYFSKKYKEEKKKFKHMMKVFEDWQAQITEKTLVRFFKKVPIPDNYKITQTSDFEECGVTGFIFTSPNIQKWITKNTTGKLKCTKEPEEEQEIAARSKASSLIFSRFFILDGVPKLRITAVQKVVYEDHKGKGKKVEMEFEELLQLSYLLEKLEKFNIGLVEVYVHSRYDEGTLGSGAKKIYKNLSLISSYPEDRFVKFVRK